MAEYEPNVSVPIRETEDDPIGTEMHLCVLCYWVKCNKSMLVDIIFFSGKLYDKTVNFHSRL
jgi:hypothetical protein